MKIAIADDQCADRQKLSDLIESSFAAKGYHVYSIDQFESGESLLKQMEEKQYDLIFLDIYMDGINGIETARKIRTSDQTVKLIFITTSNDFASESYSVRAADYLLKPYGEEEVRRMISHLDLSEMEAKRQIVFPDGQQILLRSVVYTSYSGHYVSIQLNNGRAIRIRTTQTICNQLILPYSGFVSCNKGMLVNLREVDKLETDRFIMKNGIHVPISRRRYAEVKKAYCDFLVNMLQEG